jgi:mono/diheme cytochrome c family protein
MKSFTLPTLLLGLASAATGAIAADIPYTLDSIARGKVLYVHMCVECHSADGKSTTDVIADSEDLSDPTAYRNGSSNEAIDKSIWDGAGVGMPAYRGQLKSYDEVIHMRHFMQSLWPEKLRPQLVK